MSRILVVDDNVDFAAWATHLLSDAGSEVITATNGRDAIDLAIKHHPDLLLIDWMLRDGTNGLQITEALRTIGLAPPIVLMSGLSSADLQADASDLGIAECLEKPFTDEQLLAALTAAAARPTQPNTPPAPLGVVQLDQAERVVYANPRAKYLFSRTQAGSCPADWATVLGDSQKVDLAAAEHRWVPAFPIGPTRDHWHVRAQPLRTDGSRLIVILLADDPHLRHQRLIEIILGADDQAGLGPLGGRLILVVDADQMFRRLCERMLSAARIDSYTAGTYAQAGRLLQQDSSIAVLILDLDQANEHTASFLRACHLSVPELIIFGAASDSADEWQQRLGIEYCLSKPWTVSSLLDSLEEALPPTC